MNTQNSPPRRALRWCATFCAWLAPLWAAQVSAQTYSQLFTGGQQTPDSSQVCSTWRTFQSSILSTTNYGMVTLRGSNNGTGFTCTGATANTICQRIRSDDHTTTSFVCDGHTWYLGGCGNGLEINVDAGGICNCSSGNIGTVRPCIGNDNWGGFNGNTCGGGSQTLEVICGQVGPNDPPTIQALPNRTDDEGVTISLQVQATDPQGNSITYSATNLPTGLSLNTSTGLISGTISGVADLNSPYSVTVSASDGFLSSQRSFTWTINNTINVTQQRYSQLFTGGQQTPDNSQVCSTWRTFQSSLQSGVTYDQVTLAGSNNEPGFTCTGTVANDICQRIRSDNHTTTSFVCNGNTWYLGGCGNGLEVNVNAGGICNCSSGNIGTVRPCIGNDNWGGFNGNTCGGGSQRLDVTCTVSAPNNPPSVTAISDQTSDEGTTISLQVQATDVDPNTTLVYSATGLPTGLSINTSTGLISGTLGNQVGRQAPYVVTVTVSDGRDQTSRQFNWTVNNNINITLQSYVGSFTGGQQTPDSSQVCADWRTFQGSLDSNQTYDLVTIKGSNNTQGFTCAGSVANDICQRIRSDNHTTTSFVCDGHTWYLGGCGNGLEVNVDAGGICNCNSGNIGTVRPCIGNDNWGGFNGNTCGGGSQTLEVICGEAGPNGPPVIAVIADQVDDEGQSVSLQLSATDPEQNPITWSATGLPLGLSIHSSTGLVSGSLGASASNDSPYSVTISASDGRASSQRSFTWTINDTLQVQAVTYSEGFTGGQQTPDSSQVCSAWRSFQSNIQSNVTYDEVTIKGSNNEPGFTCTGATANTICQRLRSDDRSNVSFSCDGHTWYLGGCGNGLEVNVDAGGICNCNSGNIGTVRPCIGNDNWGGFNGNTCGGGSQRLDVICGESGPNLPPVLGALANQSHDEGDAISLQLTANDPNGSNLTWSATGLPPGLTLNTGTGLISGTLSNLSSDGSPHTVNVTVSDGQLDDTGTFTWTVQDVPITTVRVLVLSPSAGDAQPVADALNNQTLVDIEADALSSNTVTLGQLQPYNAVLIFTNHSPSNPGPLGDLLADYVDGGGGVVEAVFTQYSTSFDIEGRWDSQNYTLVNRTSEGIYTSGTLGTRQQPSHPILAGVNGVTVSAYRTGTAALRSGAARVADYNDGQLLSGVREDKNGRVAWVGFYPFSGHSGDSLRLLANSLAWTAGQGQNNNQNQAPALTSPQTQRGVEGASASLQLSATDPEGDALTWSATGLPPGLSINTGTGLISGNIAQGARANSPYAVTLSVSDGALSANGAFSWIIYDDQAPAVTWSAPAETWHTAQVTVTAALSEPGCDQDPTVQNDGGLSLALTGSQGAWSVTGAVSSGRYAPLQLSVTSACTGLTTLATRAFGVDPSAPQVILTQLSQVGVDPMDSNTWPGVGEFDLISLLMQARDPESGVAQLQVTLTDLDAMTTDTLHTQSFTTSGAPPTGPTLAPVVACSAQNLCDNGRLQLSALNGARYALEVRLTNGAGAQLLDRRLFRRVGLVEAIVAWRQRSAATLSSQVPEAALALQRADDYFAVAVHSAQQGQWGSVTLTLQVAWASQRAAKALDPALDLDLSASPRELVGRSFTHFLIQRSLTLRDQGADADTLDTADGFLTDALQTTEAGTVHNLLANAWFWMEDAVDPMSADDYGQSRALLARILDEMDDYITHDPALVGQALLADARVELSEVLTLIQRVVTNGDLSLSDLEHVRLLLGLTNTAEFLASAQNQGAWVRNWQWGLTQIVYIYAARGLNNAASILGTNNPVIASGYQSLDEAALYRDERMADDFMLLLINSRCLILSIYNFAYNPDEVPPQVCCEDMIRFSELDPRFPVPDLCANSAPSLTPLADRANTVGQSINLQPAATDDDNDALTWSATGLPPGLSINPNTGLISGTITSGVNSPYTVTVTVSDGFDEDLTTFSWVVQQGSMLGYLGSFIGGQNTPDSSQVCADWRTFQGSLQSNTSYTSVTLRGSNNPQGFTCAGATANTICQRLRSDDRSNVSFSCDGHTWYLGGCGNGLEVNVDAGGICNCNSGNIGTVRPCIGNDNWGGFNGNTCGGGSQTLEVICQ